MKRPYASRTLADERRMHVMWISRMMEYHECVRCQASVKSRQVAYQSLVRLTQKCGCEALPCYDIEICV